MRRPITHVASMTTPTPDGPIASVKAWAICIVNRSCTVYHVQHTVHTFILHVNAASTVVATAQWCKPTLIYAAKMNVVQVSRCSAYCSDMSYFHVRHLRSLHRQLGRDVTARLVSPLALFDSTIVTPSSPVYINDDMHCT